MKCSYNNKKGFGIEFNVVGRCSLLQFSQGALLQDLVLGAAQDPAQISSSVQALPTRTDQDGPHHFLKPSRRRGENITMKTLGKQPLEFQLSCK